MPGGFTATVHRLVWEEAGKNRYKEGQASCDQPALQVKWNCFEYVLKWWYIYHAKYHD